MTNHPLVIAAFVALAIVMAGLGGWRSHKKRRTVTTDKRNPPQRQNHDLDRIDRRLERIESKLNVATWFIFTTKQRTGKIMATLDDLVAAATEEDTKIDSLIALVVALKAKVDAIPGITPEQQAKIDAAFASITDNPQRIQDAIDANTPADPNA